MDIECNLSNLFAAAGRSEGTAGSFALNEKINQNRDNIDIDS